MRASHLHFMVTAEGCRRLITHIFVRGDELLTRDAVFGVRDSLVKDFTRHEPGTPTPDGRDIGGRSWSFVEFDIVLAPEGRRREIPGWDERGSQLEVCSRPSACPTRDASNCGSGTTRRRSCGSTCARTVPLQASEVTVRSPRVTLARVRASSHAIERSAGAITEDPCDAIAVY
jgi:hypothetical protein